MTNLASEQVQAADGLLHDGELLTGHIVEPFIDKDGKLAGAILAFDNRRETALMHIRQMTGDSASSRLEEMSIGDPWLVRLLVQNDGAKRSVWATEKGVGDQLIIDAFAADPEKFKDIDGVVQGTTKYGFFVELVGGAAQGQRGLLRLVSLSGVTASGRVKLGAFIQYKIGDPVSVDLAEARFDDENSKLLLRLENMRPRVAA